MTHLVPTSTYPATCGCNKFLLDSHGDHVSTCKSHSGATKAHDWMVTQLGPLFRITGHKVKTQGIIPSSGQKRGDIEIINYLSDSAGTVAIWFHFVRVSISVYECVSILCASPFRSRSSRAADGAGYACVLVG